MPKIQGSASSDGYRMQTPSNAFLSLPAQEKHIPWESMVLDPMIKVIEGVLSLHKNCFGPRTNRTGHDRPWTTTSTYLQTNNVIPEIYLLDGLLGESMTAFTSVGGLYRRLLTVHLQLPPPVTFSGAQRILSGVFSTLKRNCQLIHACRAGQHGKTPDFLHLPIRVSTHCR